MDLLVAHVNFQCKLWKLSARLRHRIRRNALVIDISPFSLLPVESNNCDASGLLILPQIPCNLHTPNGNTTDWMVDSTVKPLSATGQIAGSRHPHVQPVNTLYAKCGGTAFLTTSHICNGFY